MTTKIWYYENEMHTENGKKDASLENKDICKYIL